MSEHLQPAEKPITESDEFIAQQLEGASIPTLMMSLIHLTGDTSLLQRHDPPEGRDDGWLSGRPERGGPGERARTLALQALKDYRDRGCTLPQQPDRRRWCRR